MKSYRTVLIIGIIEVLIGSVTLFANLFLVLLAENEKSFNVLMFVVIAACMSTLIGIGILKFKRLAYQLLLYFSSVIILTKFLIFFDIMQLNNALEVVVPGSFKNLISVFYHGFIVAYLLKPDVKQIFHH
jgi:hypothetical protein